MTFSERLGYKPLKTIQYEEVNETLRNRIWNLFYLNDIQAGGIVSKRFTGSLSGEPTVEDKVIDKLGFTLNVSDMKVENKKLIFLKDYISKCLWCEVYDFVEAHIASLDEEDKEDRIIKYNNLFEAEKSGYRFLNGELTPITNQNELLTIDEASSTPYDSVNQHLKKALLCFSDRKQPDYENTIKESISAVEAMCCIINGRNETLNKALKRLKENGIHIHSAMESAFISLYGYTSDEKGIRHAGIDFVNTPAEDAKYMLVSCSAFVNYLIEKWSKVGTK